DGRGTHTSALIRPGITGYELDGDTLLFLEHRGELLRLNPTAALIWRGLASGLSSRDIIESLVQVLDAPSGQVKRNVTDLMTSLKEAGVLDAPVRNRATHVNKVQSTRSIDFRRAPHQQVVSRERCYRLVDFVFRLRVPSAIEQDAHHLLAHLSLPEGCST